MASERRFVLLRSTAVMAGEDSSGQYSDDVASHLKEVSDARYVGFIQGRGLQELEEAIRSIERSVSITPQRHEQYVPRLEHHAIFSYMLYEKTRDHDVLRRAILLQRKIVSLTADNDPERGRYLDNLASMHKAEETWVRTLHASLKRRYESINNIDDLNEAIRILQEAINLPAESHFLMECTVTLLFDTNARYKRTNHPEHLRDAAQAAREAVKAIPPDQPPHFEALSALRRTLRVKYQVDGRQDCDLNESIDAGRRMLESPFLNSQYDNVTLDVRNPGSSGDLLDLSECMAEKYVQTHRPEDLEEAITIQHRIHTRMPVDASAEDKADVLQHLAKSHYVRYESTGERDDGETDLDVSMKFAKEAVETATEPGSIRFRCLEMLAECLQLRLVITQDTEDMRKLINAAREAISIAPDASINLAKLNGLLAAGLLQRATRTRSKGDMSEAVCAMRRAIEVTPETSRDLPYYLDGLALLLLTSFETFSKADLEKGLPDDFMERLRELKESIATSERCIQLAASRPEWERARYEGTRRDSLLEVFFLTGDRGAIEAAKAAAKRVIELMPEDSPDRALEMIKLGATQRLSSDTDYTQNPDIYEVSNNVFVQASRQGNANPFTRMMATFLAVEELLDRQNDECIEVAYQLASSAISIMTRMHNRSLTTKDRQDIINYDFRFTPIACSLALRLEKKPFEALELLERGRAKILGLLIDARSDTSALKATFKEQYLEYERLQTEVNTNLTENMSERERDLAWDLRSSAHAKLRTCIDEIRQLPGHDQFLKPLSEDDMRQCAENDYIVIVNTSRLRSDAIVVSRRLDSVKSIPLPGLIEKEIQSWIDKDLTRTTPSTFGEKNKEYRQFLSWLWKGMRPVMKKLGMHNDSKRVPEQDLPRIWWIGTGLASYLPFHAAGITDENGKLEDGTHRWALSSHAPSIKALAFSKRAHLAATPATTKLMIVTMPDTPGAAPLSRVLDERDRIKRIVPSALSPLNQPDAAQVLTTLQQQSKNNESSVIHFACHGKSYSDPSTSGLLLQKATGVTAGAEPELDILTVSQVSQAFLPGAMLAYLSACSTAENKSEILQDEVLHVASGFQVAGFRHVVGCLWPSLDDVCITVAETFYENLVEDGHLHLTDRNVALALWKAVNKIRGCDEYREQPLVWAQYVHFGA